jgi:uncharacterized repeat protein (TIGR03803 family)
LLIGSPAWAQELSVLSSFAASAANVASSPNSSLVEDSSGNFYGTTSAGGTSGSGTVYKIAPDGTVSVLHSFGGTVTLGSTSASTSIMSSSSSSSSSGATTADSFSGITIVVSSGGTLTLGSGTVGNGYGGTGTVVISGGTLTVNNPGGNYLGVLGSSGGTTTSATVADGSYPTGNIILASNGYLYGTTPTGGPGGGGIVYKLSTSGSYTIIGIFTAGTGTSTSNTAASGFYPVGGVIQGKDLNLYGTTSQGGDNGLGVVFEIQLSTNTYSVIHDFTSGGDAANPYTALVQDTQGNLYGTTAKGGTAGWGTVYKIDTSLSFSVITNFAAPSYTFTFNSNYAANTLGGYSPISPLAVGPDGNLYGTASGSTYGSGAAYKVTPQGQLTLLHYFGDGSITGDGSILGVSTAFSTITLVGSISPGSSAPAVSPVSADRLVVGTDGNFYGVTYAGGSAGKGTVFQMTPAGQVTIFHSFGDGTITSDGASPVGLIEGKGTDGNFYGTTVAGGSAGGGTAFKITTALPMFTSPLQVTTATNAPFTYQMAATQGPDTFTATGLPTGFSFDGTSIIAATPTQAGTYTVTLTATNAAGTTTVPLTIVVTSPPVITSLLDVVGSTTSLGYQILATQGPTSYAATGLPPGVSLNPITGVFYGVPTAAGSYQVSVSATNAVGTGSAVVDVTILSTTPTSAQEYMTIHNFQDGSVNGEGSFPGQMIAGKDTTLYGVTAQGGTYGDGTIFDVSPAGLATVVATFNGTNGAQPMGVIQTSDGTLYGTTQSGGTANAGTIFKIAPGTGVITVLHTFGDGSITNDGANPQAGLVLGSDGNFYGTTQYGGSAKLGTVFQVTPAGAVTIVHSFGDGSVTNDGAQPVAALVQDANISFSGGGIALVGTTLQGGANGTANSAPGDGTLFVMSSTGSTVHILHSFGDPNVSGGDGQLPRGPVTINQLTIYGTTTTGGSIGKGTIYSMPFAASEVTILHNFGDRTVANDGENPNSALVVAPPVTLTLSVGSGTVTGTLTLSGANGATPNGMSPVTIYGTTQNGGTAGSGTVYSCAVAANSATVTILHNNGDVAFSNDGSTPLGGLCIGADGSLYGTTIGGGAGAGTVYGLEINQGIASNSVDLPAYTCTGTIPAGLTFNSATGVLSGTPLVSDAYGVYSLVITPTGSLTSTAKTISITLNQSYTSWMSQLTTAMTSSGSTGAAGSDIVPPVLKYLVGANPSQPMTPGEYANLPTLGMDSTSQPGTTFLSLTWRQGVGATGVGVVLESSTDMVNWSPVTGTNLLSQTVSTDSSGNTTMEMGAKMTGSPEQFVRLQVTPPSQ